MSHSYTPDTTKITYDIEWQTSDGRWVTAPAMTDWDSLEGAQQCADRTVKGWGDTEVRFVKVTTTREVLET